ncbi:hypothetical protein B4U80_12117, partial [Leptotrombidium deliense]
VYAEFETCLSDSNCGAELVSINDQRYNEFNYQVNIRKMVKPLGYILIKTTKDVQKAVSCAKTFGVSLSIMSGKHAFEKSSYGNNNNNYVIDLSQLKNVTVNTTTMTATVEPGITLMSLSEILWNAGKYGFTVGTCPSVGLSGFALGGGFSLTSRTFGLAVDRMIGFKIVTADEQVRNVSKDENSDLFWALRGAGNRHFGIVTQLKIKIFNATNEFIWIRKQYTGILCQLRQLFTQWQAWIAANPSDSVTADFVKGQFSCSQFTLTFVIRNKTKIDSENQLKLIMSKFTSITMSDVRTGSYMDVLNATASDNWAAKNRQFYYRSKGFYVSKFLNESEITSFVIAINTNYHAIFVASMYGGEINKRQRNETAYVHRTSLYVMQFIVQLEVANYGTVEITQLLGKTYEDSLKSLVGQLQFMSNGEHYQNYEDYDLLD